MRNSRLGELYEQIESSENRHAHGVEEDGAEAEKASQWGQLYEMQRSKVTSLQAQLGELREELGQAQAAAQEKEEEEKETLRGQLEKMRQSIESVQGAVGETRADVKSVKEVVDNLYATEKSAISDIERLSQEGGDEQQLHAARGRLSWIATRGTEEQTTDRGAARVASAARPRPRLLRRVLAR